MTGEGWVWIGSDGVLATPPTNQSTATQAMQGTVGTMPKGTWSKFKLQVEYIEKQKAYFDRLREVLSFLEVNLPSPRSIFISLSFYRRDRKMDSQNAVQVDETQRQQETVSRNYLWQCTSEYRQYMFNAEKFRAGLFLLYSTTVFSWASKIITWDCLRFALLCVLFGSGNSHLIDRNRVHFFGREICLYLVWIFDDSLQYLTLYCLAFWFCYLSFKGNRVKWGLSIDASISACNVLIRGLTVVNSSHNSFFSLHLLDALDVGVCPTSVWCCLCLLLGFWQISKTRQNIFGKYSVISSVNTVLFSGLYRK